MAGYQQGDFGAATDLIERISPQLHRFFLAQSLSRTDADDLLQETWLRIHKVRHTYRPGEPALPWFYAIARHVRVDHYRKSIRTTAGERRLEAMSKEAAAVPSESDHADEPERAAGAASRQPARGNRDVEGCRDVVGRGSTRHLFERWIGKAEGAQSVQEIEGNDERHADSGRGKAEDCRER